MAGLLPIAKQGLANEAPPAATPMAPLAVTPMARLDDAAWAARHEANLVEARSRPIDLVLLGDSITQNYELTGPDALHDYRDVWRRFYADRHALNLGVSGDGTAHVLWRIAHGALDGLAPRLVVILIGTNDIGWLGRSAADTVRGIVAVVEDVYLRLPGAKILLVGVLPSDRGPLMEKATAEINAALAARYGEGETSWVTYRDIAAAFMSNGALDLSLFSDPLETPPGVALHPSPDGQRRMAAALEPTLGALLGDHPAQPLKACIL